ncbi:hypothetical protein PSTT_13287 [Puccinia striiformis]|uniref:Uncharacterized protein n=1 Tax=Puccinia striiformis TaxID=27350 RepID=A0A2S4USB9_9BASI|nr:hypothetical protein PSTT_13287 [Puccinia striiformis]
MTTHLTPAQRAEVHAALNKLSRVYTEHQATTTTANSNRKQQPTVKLVLTHTCQDP